MSNTLKHNAELLGRGIISRREFISRAASLGAGTMLAASLANRAVRAAEAKKGGKLRIALGQGSTSDTLDPATFTGDFTRILSYSVFNHLTEIGSGGDLIPNLAVNWEPSVDATTWTFELRKGVEFHDGRSLTAKDVIASINHHRGEEAKSGAKPLVDPIIDIKSDGKYVVVVILEGGNADFPFLLSDYHLPIMPASEHDGIDWEAGVGTGPYTLESFEPGVHSTHKRNPNYWREGVAHIDEAEVIAIFDSTARTNALMSGEVDVIDRVDLKIANNLERDPEVRLEQTSGNTHYTFSMHTDKEPYNDNNVRLALKHAIDREEILEKILHGYGYLGNDHPIGKANRFYAADLPQRQYDPDKARFYLKKAGRSSLDVSLHAADAAFPGAVDAAVLYKEKAAPVGVNINVVREPNDGYWSDVWLQDPWVAVIWLGRPTEDWMFSTVYAEGAPWNDTHWTHERFNKLLKEARAELDTKKRREMYVEMQQLVRDDGGAVIPMFANSVFAMRKKVQHSEEMANNLSLDGMHLMERWWLAE